MSERRHWFRTVALLREPPVERTASRKAIDPIRRGLVVHDVLEHWREGASLDALIDAAMSRHDPGAPPASNRRGQRYRRVIRSDVAAALAHPEYRAVLDVYGSRRELSFLHVHAPGVYLEGMIDLVAPGDRGYHIVDIKTGGGDAATAARKAEDYALQRAAYVNTVGALSGGAVASFALHFPGAGAHVGGALSDADRDLAGTTVSASLARLHAGEAPRMASTPSECRHCGYRRVGWCTGVDAVEGVNAPDAPFDAERIEPVFDGPTPKRELVAGD